MKKNQYFIGECTEVTEEGQGIVFVDGIPYYVKGLFLDEKANLKVIKVLKTYGIARVIDIIEPSVYRVSPRCDIASLCGGCHLQHLSLKGQQIFKQRVVEKLVKNTNQLNCKVEETIMPNNSWYYRNKVQMPFGFVKGNLETGFYKTHSNEIIPTKSCLIQNKVSNLVVNRIKNLMIEFDIQPYDRNTKKGFIKHVLTKYGFATDELMVVFITNGKDFKHLKEIIEILVLEFDNIKSIIQNINERDDNVILGETEIVLYGNEYIEDMLNGFKFQISSKSFYQINPPQVEALYNKAIELANLNQNDTVIDAYCGIGTISLSVAKKVKEVIGVEVVKEAIDDAINNAKVNCVSNATFVVGDAGEFMVDLATQNKKIDVVFVDPPRKGCSKEFLRALNVLEPKKIVYISCNPKTQIRDALLLKEYGYNMIVCQPVDLFSHTYHVENIILFSK